MPEMHESAIVRSLDTKLMTCVPLNFREVVWNHKRDEIWNPEPPLILRNVRKKRNIEIQLSCGVGIIVLRNCFKQQSQHQPCRSLDPTYPVNPLLIETITNRQCEWPVFCKLFVSYDAVDADRSRNKMCKRLTVTFRWLSLIEAQTTVCCQKATIIGFLTPYRSHGVFHYLDAARISVFVECWMRDVRTSENEQVIPDNLISRCIIFRHYFP